MKPMYYLLCSIASGALVLIDAWGFYVSQVSNQEFSKLLFMFLAIFCAGVSGGCLAAYNELKVAERIVN